MLSEKEKAFIKYWEENRIKEKSIFRHISPGLSIGLCLGAAIMLIFDSGWYERANIIAQSESSPIVLIIGIIAIVVFMSFFYKKFTWERNEQTYTELKLKYEKERQSEINTNEP